MSIQDLFEAARNLSPEDRKKWVRIAAGGAMALIILVGFLIVWISGRVVPAESPVWEAALQGRLIIVRLIVALGLIPFGVLLGSVVHAAIEKTEQGRRLWTWADADTAVVRAEKTRNSGAYLLTITAAIVLGLLIGVLR